jgi:hypothetical protein
MSLILICFLFCDVTHHVTFESYFNLKDYSQVAFIYADFEQLLLDICQLVSSVTLGH